MHEFPASPENESALPRLKESVIKEVATKVYVELDFASCDNTFDCFSGGGPTSDDEDALIRRFMEQAMASRVSIGAPLDEAIEQYKQAINEAGGLEEFLESYANRREARERQQAADFTSEQVAEVPDRQIQDVSPSEQKLGGSAIKRLFRR